MICPTCGKKFWASPIQEKYCTEKCSPKILHGTRMSTCINCKQRYELLKNFQIYCSDLCERAYEEKQENLYNQNCIECGKIFRKTQIDSHQKICYACKEVRKKTKYYSEKKYAIEEWVKKERKKGLSFEELNRRAEWKRVFGQNAWDHYCKGRKWDKI